MQPARLPVSPLSRWLAAAPAALVLLYLLDRLLKLAAVMHFMRQPAPPPPASWPTVSLLQPITRGASDLPAALACRAALHYPARLQHILICDAGDHDTRARCAAWIAANPQLEAVLVVVGTDAPPTRQVATKIEKLNAGLAHADGDVLCFVDDDILLRPDALVQLAPHLARTRAGSAFGLACYVNWSNPASSLLSAFVNANALLSYVPLTYLTDPYTITGHFYAIPRPVFVAAGGLTGLEGRFDDDHELARRVQKLGLRNLQTPVIYDVNNQLNTFYDYANQMRRWFVIPRQTMAPFLNTKDQVLSLASSLGALIPPLLALLLIPSRTRREAARALPLAFGIAAVVYHLCERSFLRRTMPPSRWPLVLISTLLAPLQALAALVSSGDFTWRGQRIRLHRGGKFDVL